MASRSTDAQQTKKLKRPIDREFNSALYFLRCKQMGLTLHELLGLNYGDVVDMMIESANDREKYDYKATQNDFDTVFH